MVSPAFCRSESCFSTQDPFAQSAPPPVPGRHVLRGLHRGICQRYARRRPALRFLIVHGHSGQMCPVRHARSYRVRLAVRAFRIHIDQPHLTAASGFLQVSFSGSSASRPAICLRTPQYISSHPFPNIRTARRRSRGFKPHRLRAQFPTRFIRSAQDILLPLFLFDWPERRAAACRVYIIRPAVERRKALCTVALAPPRPSLRTVGACAVPCHPNGKAGLSVPSRRGQPVLRVGHQCVTSLLFHCF